MYAQPIIHQDRIRRRDSISPGRTTSAHTRLSSTRKTISRPSSSPPADTKHAEERANSREWWRSYIKDTPNPGAYDIKDFLHYLEQRPGSYNFKGQGRQGKLLNFLEPGDHGPYLLPGCYNTKDFVEEASTRQWSYNFKSIDRETGPKIGHGCGDKEISTSPNQYVIPDAWGEQVTGSRYAAFKSETKRFPSAPFKPKDGPSPGDYNPNHVVVSRKAPAVTSSFKSVVPRFYLKESRVPGPGTYTKILQTPMPKMVAQMGRHHGIFFQSLSVYS
ncbi:protein STPG4-like [Corticium candelabrum]|uniref:protein STPG4-like n=1 Tax=Corticium candelabrum TaxID=121492 RepID=UPI002E263C32|nr:protein STPG4-like [Corticium candelabrum]